jgi:hypothetical protein
VAAGQPRGEDGGDVGVVHAGRYAVVREPQPELHAQRQALRRQRLRRCPDQLGVGSDHRTGCLQQLSDGDGTGAAGHGERATDTPVGGRQHPGRHVPGIDVLQRCVGRPRGQDPADVLRRAQDHSRPGEQGPLPERLDDGQFAATLGGGVVETLLAGVVAVDQWRVFVGVGGHGQRCTARLET